jgi:hypothetical protein
MVFTGKVGLKVGNYSTTKERTSRGLDKMDKYE